MRVNLGCGQTPIIGWKNFDNSPTLRLARIPFLPEILGRLGILGRPQREFIDFLHSNRVEHADVTRRLPIADGAVEVVYSSHMMEHLDRQDVLLFLAETMRVLRPGGILRLVVPDLRKQVENYLKDGDADALVDGTGLAPPRSRSLQNRLRLMLAGTRHHQWMYDGNSVCRLLEKAGFVHVTIVAPGESRIPNPGPLDLWERAAESVYVEAEKA